jgi:hypothetical protein
MPPSCKDVKIKPGPAEISVQFKHVSVLARTFSLCITCPTFAIGPIVATTSHESKERPRLREEAPELSRKVVPRKVEDTAVILTR